MPFAKSSWHRESVQDSTQGHKNYKQMARDLYGFVGYVSSIVIFGRPLDLMSWLSLTSTGGYMSWAVLPDHILDAIGLTYRPHKYVQIGALLWLLT